LSDLAFNLAERGRDVAVVGSRQLYGDPGARLAARETVEGVDVRRVWTTRFGRSGLLGRAIDYATFYPPAVLALWSLARAGDIIVAATDPPLISVPCAIVARLKGARLVNWLQDLFPEVSEALDVPLVRGPLGGVLRRLRDWSLHTASVNVVLGAIMAHRVIARGVLTHRVRVIPNWADGQAIRPLDTTDHPLRTAWGLDGTFVVGYAGNLGRAHEAATVLAAARLTQADPSIVWLFVGGGKGRPMLEQAVAEESLGGFVFRPYQPREALGAMLTAADVHLVTLRPELEGLIVPSKVYGVMAAGRPVVFIGDSEGEVARLVREHDCGAVIGAGDGAGLAAVIQALRADPDRRRALGANARAAFEDRFDKTIALGAWRAVLQD
jgi:glycosyltransferase involved in cell wall biosynthesis